MIKNKHQNVPGPRESRSERRGRFDNLWHKVGRKGPDLKDGLKAATS